MMRSAVLLAAAGLLGVGLSAGVAGCGAGQNSQTESQRGPNSGVDIGSADGTIQLRDIAFVYGGPEGYPQGGTAALQVRIFNQGKTPVRLVGVTSEKGTAVLSGPSAAPPPPPAPPPAPSSPAPSGSGSPSGAVPPSGSVPSSGSVPPSPAPAPATSSSAPVGNPQIDIEIPVAGFVVLTPGSDRYVQLTGLAEEIVPGQTVVLTFRFDNGITITTPVPTAIPLSPLPRSPMEFEEEGH
jgi:copper(I)-binding protein